MSFSLCLNRDEVLLLAGFGLLYQTLELDCRGKLIQDSQRLLCSVTSMLEQNRATGASEFKKVTCAMISIDRFSKGGRTVEATGPRRKSDGIVRAPKGNAKASNFRRLSTIASGPSVKPEVSTGRRSTAPTLPRQSWPGKACKNSQRSLSSVLSGSTPQYANSQQNVTANVTEQMYDSDLPNLDYLDFNTDQSSRSDHISPNSTNILKTSYNEMPGCSQPPTDSVFSSPELFPSTSPGAQFDWTSDLWTMPIDMAPASQSALSFSEDELTSGEELSSCDTNGTYNGITIPQDSPLAGLDDLDGRLGL